MSRRCPGSLLPRPLRSGLRPALLAWGAGWGLLALGLFALRLPPRPGERGGGGRARLPRPLPWSRPRRAARGGRRRARGERPRAPSAATTLRRRRGARRARLRAARPVAAQVRHGRLPPPLRGSLVPHPQSRTAERGDERRRAPLPDRHGAAAPAPGGRDPGRPRALPPLPDRGVAGSPGAARPGRVRAVPRAPRSDIRARARPRSSTSRTPGASRRCCPRPRRPPRTAPRPSAARPSRRSPRRPASRARTSSS